MSVEVLLPSPRVNMLDTATHNSIEGLALPTVCGPHRGIRRPSGTNDSESDSPPSKKSKKARRRRKKPRQRCLPSKGLRTKPVAPFNTTQFLMAEHDQLQDTDIVVRPRRQRDSSFSVDSDDQNNFYSSPEDEDEFMAREFWNAYEDVHAERLDTMTKAQLVQEYLALEEKVDLLERQLRHVRARHRYSSQHQIEEEEEDDDEEMLPGEVKVDPETAQKITIFQREISNLEVENRKLREENLTLRRGSSARSSSSSSSSDSSSDSSSSSSSDSSSESSDDEGAAAEDRTMSSVPKKDNIVVASSASPPSVLRQDDDEAVVSASDKIECHADSHLCHEQEEPATAAEATSAGPTAVLPDGVEEGGGEDISSGPAHSLSSSDPPTSSTSVGVADPPTSASATTPDTEETIKEEVDMKTVEEEVTSTTAA